MHSSLTLAPDPTPNQAAHAQQPNPDPNTSPNPNPNQAAHAQQLLETLGRACGAVLLAGAQPQTLPQP